MHRNPRIVWLLVALSTVAGSLLAQVEPEKPPHIAEKAFEHLDLEIPAFNQEIGQLPAGSATEARARLSRMSVAESSARVDRRSGRFVTLLPTTPLIPGRGVGNDLTWDGISQAAPQDTAAIEQAAFDAFRGFLVANQLDLGIDVAELGSHRIAAHDGGDLVQIWIPRQFDGIPVRDSYLTAVIGQGNLTLMSAHQWGDRGVSNGGVSNGGNSLDADQALRIAEDYLAPLKVTREWGKAERIYVPMAVGRTLGDVSLGRGYAYRLVWSVKLMIDGDQGRWEVLVDVSNGEVLANVDRNVYAEAKGGVYPVTNDGIVPDGVEQPGWPMPWLTVSTSGGNVSTDTGGNFSATGSFTASLTGQFVRMNDNCGASSLTQVGGLDFGTSGGTDCTTPGFGGAGNTHSSRSGFYELNRTKEMARSQLPSNGWLQNQLTANMNINSTCNAFWNGSTVNFYRSGGGCSNTGEIAGVFVHEWGHGMDANDVVGGIASPSGEGIADIYTALRLNDSCIGRNFRSTPCSGNGDPCITCTGVRDIDYLARQSGQPHDYSWSNANCFGSVHCVGGVYSEAVWSLWKRKLQQAPYNLDNNTAHEIVNRLTFLGAGATGTWFSGGPPNGGCGGSSGYMNYLAADDDNGNLNDGTPHMTAIWESFNDQEIACNTPTVQDSGCSGTPSAAPDVTATAGDQQVALSWNTITGASEYEVFRAEGIFACDFGKVKVADVTGTSFTDTNLQNGRDYSYVVIPKGSSDACFGNASACDTVQPVGAPPVPDFAVSCSPSSLTRQQGQSGGSTCTVTALNGYTGSVSLSCSGQPAGISCGFSPSTVSPTADSSATFTIALSQATGTYDFDVVGDDGTDTRSAPVSITVTPEGQNGPLDAVFDAGLGVPACAIPGSSCDSTTLLDSRSASLSPPEPNASNTLDTCTDGTFGSYHNDESIDRIVVSSLDGFDFAEGATVQVDVTVYAWSTGTSDHLDLYYADDANNPTWTLITTIDLSSGGLQTLSAQYTLPTGGLQAVRANFRYNGSQSPCSGGSYDDADDLVFAVGGAAPQCSVDADCDDGLFCNGAETCNAGSCQAGTAPNCDDGVACTIDSCNETTDACDAAPDDGLCDNGLFCDGSETCNATLGCQAGTAPNCDDGVACTVDACNEGSDSCDNTPDDGFCDNGLFCDGAEVCNATLGCQDSADPCPAGTCDEVGDVCTGGSQTVLEWGNVSVGGSAVTVNLANTFTNPVVVATVQYANNTTPVVTRISSVTGSSFAVRLQNPSGGAVVTDNVSYLVAEEGAWNVDGFTFEAWTYTSTVTDENNSWVGQAQSYANSYTSPVVLGQVMSENDAAWSVFWNRGSARNSPPSASALVTGKTVCEDPSVARANETVGIIVFETAHGTLGGVETEASLGADSVRGVTNSPPYTYTFDTAFASAPTVGLATMAGVDGGNGGWAYTYGSTMATASTLALVIDEDQVGDNERNHTTEQVGYVVFASPGSVDQ